MERREILKNGLFAVGGAVAASAVIVGLDEKKVKQTAAAPAIAKERVEIAMVATWGRDFPGLGTGAQRFAKRLSDMSDGRIQVTYYAANERVKAFDSFDEVASGNAQMYHGADYYWKGKHPGWAYFCAVPFGMTYTEINAWMKFGGGQELHDELAAGYGLKCLPCGNTGVQMGGWFRKEINSVEDLKGLKMRIPGFAGEVLAKLGAKPTNIPSGELYTALERNTIDALEWVGPSLDLRMGFHKIAPYYYTGWHEPATELQFMVNQKAYDTLPADLQQILTIAMKAAAYDMYAQSMHESGVNLAKLQDEYPNVKIRSFPKDVMFAIRMANADLLHDFAKKDPQTKKILNAITDYQEQIRAWTNFSDRAYLDNFDAQ